jgi:hypothetical protein
MHSDELLIARISRGLYRVPYVVREPSLQVLFNGQRPGIEDEPVLPVRKRRCQLRRNVLPRLAVDSLPSLGLLHNLEAKKHILLVVDQASDARAVR